MSRPSLEPEYFDRLYAEDPDPWGFATSDYERDKYAATLAALPAGRRYPRALECGCANGVFTERLAPRCDALLAVDAAERAVTAARERLASRPHVSLERRVLPAELPAGPFDLVVCSEVLYYWDAATLRDALPRLRDALAPGGSLLAVHWRHPTRTYPLQGDEVHALLHAELGLSPAMTATTDDYRLDRFDRPRVA